MPDSKPTSSNPWTWIPSLYTAEGLPYVLVMTVSVVMYKGLGISNTDLALYTSWLYLPWVIKPLWSPVVDILRTRRWWIWVMQILIGGGLAGVALTIPAPNFFQWTLACFWLLAFSSATHDIAADGFYLLATTEKEQSFFVGIRTTFYRIATIFGQGLLVILAGYIQSHTGLAKVEIIVGVKPDAAVMQSTDSDWRWGEMTEGHLRIVAKPQRIQIAPQPRAKTEIAALIADAKNWNTTNNFYRTQQRAQANGKKGEGKSWWAQGVSGQLGEFLRTHLGRKSAAISDVAGNIAVISLNLSEPPGKEIVVT
ncbi:MAG: MFS transporter, partial [Verrucomicrobia bacterium]